MIDLVKAHPNIDVIVFCLLTSAVLAVTLYRFHKGQM
jgi:hypothetical protein